MFFNAKLHVDTAQASRIKKIKPQKAFKRMLYFMTFGGLADELEVQSFTAVSILQQLYQAFAQLGIDNLVRLSHNDLDFYLDSEGRKEDLKDTLDRYDLEAGESLAAGFEQLRMVLEQERGSFRYLFQISVNKSHEVGQYPIEIEVDALLKDFQGKDTGLLEQKLQPIFASQESYDSFLRQSNAEFEQYMSELQFALTRAMELKDVQLNIKKKLLIPKEKPQEQQALAFAASNNTRQQSPVYHNYYGYDNSLAYIWLWSSMCHNNQIQVNNTALVSEEGTIMQEIGPEGLATDESPLFDTEQDFDTRLEDAGLNYDSDTGDFSDVKSSSSFWSSESESMDTGSDCSSCSSCSSCGGCGD